MGIRIFVVAGKLIPPRPFGRVNRLDYLYIHPMLKRAINIYNICKAMFFQRITTSYRIINMLSFLLNQFILQFSLNLLLTVAITFITLSLNSLLLPP
jgi:hypothetical protein